MNNVILVSNQRCGSTWLVTSLGNCKSFATDYEIKWSQDLLIGKASPYHLFLKNTNFKDVFQKFPTSVNHKTLGTKFVFDFYKPFPHNEYNKFLDKFENFQVIHIDRDYIDILKSKIFGRVVHLIEPKNLKSQRVIDNTILSKQEDYIKNIKNSNNNNNKPITFNAAKSYIINLFINDVLSLSLKNKNQFLNIKYEDINKSLPKLSNFLKISLEELNTVLFKKPVIKKNNMNYKNNFENYEELKKINSLLKKKIKDLSKNNFQFEKIIFYDNFKKKLNINI